MPRKKGLEEAAIQKLHTAAPEHLTDDELLLSTFCAEDLARKHSGGWDNDHPKCRFCDTFSFTLGMIRVQDFCHPVSHDVSDQRQR
jgi:hypothetical protein